MNVEKGLLYTEDHDWIKIDGNVGTIGIADYAQHHLGDIVYVELPEVDDEFEKGDSYSSIESVKAATDVFIPMGGKVVEINDKLEDDPALLNQDPYGNWIIKVELSDPSDTKDLMNADEYTEFLEKEE